MFFLNNAIITQTRMKVYMQYWSQGKWLIAWPIECQLTDTIYDLKKNLAHSIYPRCPDKDGCVQRIAICRGGMTYFEDNSLTLEAAGFTDQSCWTYSG